MINISNRFTDASLKLSVPVYRETSPIHHSHWDNEHSQYILGCKLSDNYLYQNTHQDTILGSHNSSTHNDT